MRQKKTKIIGYSSRGGEGHSQDDEHTGYTLGQVNLFRRLTSSRRDSCAD